VIYYGVTYYYMFTFTLWIIWKYKKPLYYWKHVEKKLFKLFGFALMLNITSTKFFNNDILQRRFGDNHR